MKATTVIRFGTAHKETLQGQPASTKLSTVQMMLVGGGRGGGGGGHAAWTCYSSMSMVCGDTIIQFVTAMMSLMHFPFCEQDMNLLLLTHHCDVFILCLPQVQTVPLNEVARCWCVGWGGCRDMS